MVKYHNTNQIILDDGAKLKDFDWWLSEFSHNYETNTSIGTVKMKSGGFEHSRQYTITNPATYQEQALLNEILKLPEFINSTKL